LVFATSVDSDQACGTGLAKDHLFVANIPGTISGNIPAGWTVTVGDGGSGFAHVALTKMTTNAGALVPSDGATLTDAASLTNTGTLEIGPGGFNTVINLAGLTNKGTLFADQNGSLNLKAGATLVSQAKSKVTVASGFTLHIGNAYVNDGTVTIGAGSALSVAGTYSQASTAKFVTIITGASTFGALNVTSTASLAGTLAPTTMGFTPSSGETFLVLTSAGLGGSTFGTVSGGFTAQYSNGNVTAVFQ
jgi:hypothetical protein